MQLPCSSLVRFDSNTVNSEPDFSFSVAMGSGFDSSVTAIAIQSDDKIICGGTFTSYNGTTRNRIIRLNVDGSLDSSFNVGTGFNINVNAIAIQSDGKIICGGTFTSYNGTTINRIIRLNVDGSLDSSFNVGIGFSSTVNSIAIQSDGKIICGGTFTSYNGTTRNRIVRLNSDGSLDSTFSVGSGFNAGTVNSIAIQSDGKIICGGTFTSYNGTTRNRIVRLNSDGSLDSTFSVGSGFNTGTVNSIAIQSDDKIICGGTFTSYNGTTRNRIIRLNVDGSLDSSFNVGIGFSSTVNSIAIQSDGKIICGGGFGSYNGTMLRRVVRLNSDGNLDLTFFPGPDFGLSNTVNRIVIQSDGKIIFGGTFTSFSFGYYYGIYSINSYGIRNYYYSHVEISSVYALVRQVDGKIVCGGSFESYNIGLSTAYVFGIVRFNSDGIVDSSFNAGSGLDINNGGQILSLAIQSDGKIICAGGFSTFNGISREDIVRLNPDGSVDSSFNCLLSSVLSTIYKVVIQSDGKIIIGGNFTKCVARLNNDGTIDSFFNVGSGFNEVVNDIAIQSDGKIICVGSFTSYNGTTRNNIIRLNVDGSLDSSFNVGTGFNDSVNTIAIQSDGKIMCGGNFSSYNETSRNKIARLNSDGSLDANFIISASASSGPAQRIILL
jgi:uncharacterized delta-60 repeat protein